MIDKSSMEKKVRALLNVTVENGATEAEALTAAEKARQLIDQYQIELTGEEVKKSQAVIEFSRAWRSETVKRLNEAYFGIERLTDTYVFLSKVGIHKHRVGFLGLKEDCQLANYLCDVCFFAEKAAWEEYQKADAYKVFRKAGHHTYQIRRSLTVGFSIRIAQRMFDLARFREAQMKAAPTGTALVVVKQELIEEGKKEHGLLDIKDGKTVNSGVSHNALNAGAAAAEKVNLNNPVEAKEEAKQLS